MKENKTLNDREFWLDCLSGYQVKTQFPYDYPVSAGSRPPLEYHEFQLPVDLTERIMKLSGSSDPNLFMILAAGLSILLYRYTGEDEIMIGAPIYKQQIEGEFINTVLPLSNHILPEMTFKQFLIAARETVLNATTHQNYPIQRLLYELKLPVSNEEFPLFDVAVLLESIHDVSYLDDIPLNLILSFRSEEHAIKCKLLYHTGLYHFETIQRIAGHYIQLLNAMLSGVDEPFSRIPLITQSEKEDVVTQLKGESLDYPSNKTIQELFKEQSLRTPNHTAIIAIKDLTAAREEISYQDLEKRSNKLAHLLIGKGVTPGMPVGLLVEPSIDMAVGVLAILKAGGAYLPLDSSYPAARIDYMISDSQIDVLLSREQYLDNISFNGQAILLDDPAIQAENEASPAVEYTSSDLAYIIYTSGSSGKPKGVCVEHKSILNYIYWRIHAYEQSEADISLQMVPFSFDGFCANFYPPLLNGGACVLISEEGRRDPGFLKTIISQEKITNFSGVPSGLKLVVQEASVQDLSSLRFIVVAGEKAPASLLETCQKLNESVLLINEYGPTEASVTAAAYFPLTPRTTGIIGKSIANNHLLILDEHMNICPAGLWGELAVSGTGVAREYLRRPELNSEKFPVNPFMQGEKMYKTGDRARLRFDGNIQISGRTDQQIKHRGFRIEPGEIENCLLEVEAVKEAVVILKDTISGDGDLCAYLVTAEDVNVADIRQHISASLPDYMVPAYFIQLEQLPLTPSGKVDIKMLPALDGQTATMVFTEYVAPRNPMEEKMTGLWQQELNLEKVGVHDNYFNIGGDSIKSIPLINLVNETFEVDLKVVDLYENDTIEKLSQKVSHDRSPSGADKDSEQYNAVIEELDALKNSVIQGN